MSNRTEALARIVVGIPYLIVMSILSPIIFLGALIVWFLDLGYQIILNEPGIGNMNALVSTLRWYYLNFLWVLVGQDKFRPLPPL